MIDYIWWLWQQETGNTFPPDWDGPVPRPYGAYTLNQSLNNQNFCYTYAPFNAGGKRKRLSRKVKQDDYSYDLLGPAEKLQVDKILSQAMPSPIPKEDYHFLLHHCETDEKKDEVYQSYLNALEQGKSIYKSVKAQYGDDDAKKDMETYDTKTWPVGDCLHYLSYSGY